MSAGGPWLPGLSADALADQVGEAAFGIFAELVVVGSFLADYEASAVVAGVEPFRGRSDSATGAVEAHAGSHLDERSTLGKICGFFVLDADQGKTLIALEHSYRTYGDLVARPGLTDGAPVSCSQDHQADHEHRRQHDGGENEESFSQCSKCVRNMSGTYPEYA